MSILIHNCTAVLMDEAGTVLPNAYVVVEGTKISCLLYTSDAADE